MREEVGVESGPLVAIADYDTAYGQVVASLDFNGQLTTFGYDSLGRLTSVIDPLGTPTEPLFRYHYIFGSPDYPVSVTRVESLVERGAGRYERQWQYTDGLGRKRAGVREAEAPHGFVSEGWQRLTPRGTVSHDLSPPPAGTPVTITYADALGRTTDTYPPLTRSRPTYSRNVYLPFETWVYDERDTWEGTWLYH